MGYNQAKQIHSIIICLSAIVVSFAAPSKSHKEAFVWYTQIGTWNLEKDTVKQCTFLFHDAKVNGARSGEATSNVRYNKDFFLIKQYSATISLRSPVATAGLLIQNKIATYYFFVNKTGSTGSLQIHKREKKIVTKLASSDLKTVPDTISLLVYTQKDTLFFVANKEILAMKKPIDFDSLKWIGVECPAGIVKVFSAEVMASNGTLHENLTHATIVNLHLDKMIKPKK